MKKQPKSHGLRHNLGVEDETELQRPLLSAVKKQTSK